MVFQNRMLRRIFGPKRDEVTGGWRKLHNEELHNLYYPPNIIRMRWAGHVARMGRSAHIIVVGKPEGNRLLGRQRRRWGIILKRILGKRLGGCGLDSSGSG
jgi:hypothetical protein